MYASADLAPGFWNHAQQSSDAAALPWRRSSRTCNVLCRKLLTGCVCPPLSTLAISFGLQIRYWYRWRRDLVSAAGQRESKSPTRFARLALLHRARELHEVIAEHKRWLHSVLLK